MLASTLREAIKLLLVLFCWILNTEGRSRERDIGIPPGGKTQAVVAASRGTNEPTETLVVSTLGGRKSTCDCLSRYSPDSLQGEIWLARRRDTARAFDGVEDDAKLR